MSLHLLKKLLSVIIPPRSSERDVEVLTIEELFDLQTSQGLPYADTMVRSLVWELKYHANKRAAALAGELLAEELLAIASEELGKPLLIPVPMHRTRIKERGHNHTALLCTSALTHLGDAYEYAPESLKRTRYTPEQQKLDRKTRLENVVGSMSASDTVLGRVCVVVDDVTTTGATLAEATRALKAAGAAKVHTIALAQS